MSRRPAGKYRTPPSPKPCKKRRYRDRIAALLAIESHGRQKPRHKDTVRAYRCPDCAGWHLTSQPKRQQEGVRRG